MGIFDSILGKKKPEKEFGFPAQGYPPGPPAFPARTSPTLAVRETRMPSAQMLDSIEASRARGLVPGMPTPPPAPPVYMQRAMAGISSRPEQKQLLTQDIEAITEAVVADKWKFISNDFEKINKWRDKTDKNLSDFNKKLKDIEIKLNSIEKSMLQKIDAYSKGVSDISAEIQAIQKVFRATLPEFTSRVKELSALVENVKKIKPPKKKTKRKRAKKKSTKRKPKKRKVSRKKRR